MANLILLRNPLTPHDKEEHELSPGETPIEWLQEHYPTGFGMPIRYYVNADEMPLDDLDRMPDEDDIVIIALMPGGFLAAMPLLVKVVIGLAVMAAAFFAMQLFAPKKPAKNKTEDLDSFNISSEQNAAKLGDPIPVVYGNVTMTPDYVAQPYSWYSWNESAWSEWLSGVQYLDLIMCAGQGAVNVSQVKVGSSDAADLGPNIVKWKSFLPHEHNSQMGVISNAMGGGFYENVVTNAEVGDQEFTTRGVESPFYTICKAGTTGSAFQIDVIFPQGLFYNGGSKGKMIGAVCDFDVRWQEVDDNGNRFGPVYKWNYAVDAAPPNLGDGKDHSEICNPIRRTFIVGAGRSARWAVSILRLGNSFPANEGASTFIWSGLKLIGDSQPRAYGDVTLLAVRIKASRGIGSDAAVRVSANCQRYMAGLPNGEYQFSTNASDAFYDVYTNSLYGAGRPVAELDLPALRDAKNRWSGYQFNHVFRARSTVWEALKTITLGVAAEPLPQGSFMSIAQDGVKPTRSMLFTDANIVENTMKVNYIFDVDDEYDGVEVKYINPSDWNESYIRWPSGSVIPETVELPGCTNASHAVQYARLVWQRTRLQRKRITFDTELEGIILQLGDRIAVSHEMPRWGDSGLVIGLRGTEVIVDHDLNWSGGPKFMMFRTIDGTPSDLFDVTQGSQPNIAVVTRAINLSVFVDSEYDYTSFVFGSATTLVRDFMVATTKHTGDTTVTVEAVNYDATIYDGAMVFLGGNH